MLLILFTIICILCMLALTYVIHTDLVYSCVVTETIPTINVSEGSKRSLAALECNATSSESDVGRKGRESLRILGGMSACTDLTARTPHESRSKNLTSLAVFTSDVCVKRTHSRGASPAQLWLEITRKASLLRELTPSGPPSRPGITWQSVRTFTADVFWEQKDSGV